MAANCEELILPLFYQNAIKEGVKTENFKEMKIVATKGTSKGDGYLGELLRVTVQGVKDDGSNKSIHLILKISPKFNKKRDLFPISMYYRREIFAYSKLFPIYDQLQEKYDVPQADRFRHAKLFNAINEELNELMIFEDLGKEGFIMHDKCKPLDYDHLSLLIKNLARFHAISIVLKAKDPKAFAEISSQASNILDHSDEFLSFMERTREKISPIIEDEEERRKTTDYLKSIRSEMKRLLNSETAAPYNVICHGDCWNNNFLFKYKDGKVVDIRMVDYQLVRHGSPVTDLAYMIYLGTDKALRDNHYEELLTMYYETLSNFVALMDVDISKYFPENVYRKQIKEFMSYGFIVACAFLPIIVADPTNMPDLADIVENTPESDFAYCDEFIVRVRDIIKFFIENGIV